jgi:23S rRNA pseudouridine2457 synthase
LVVIFNKPWGVLSQFSDRAGRLTLADFIDLPDIYPAGRLDRDSEGLLVLTDDGRMQNRIADPVHGVTKDYLVQVEGRPTHGQLRQLRMGVQLADGPARALDVNLLARKPGWLWPRDPPIRSRKHVPVSWLRITLDEGRNRQVRRMTAAAGLPALRLVRVRVGDCKLGDLQPGTWRLEGPR